MRAAGTRSTNFSSNGSAKVLLPGRNREEGRPRDPRVATIPGDVPARQSLSLCAPNRDHGSLSFNRLIKTSRTLARQKTGYRGLKTHDSFAFTFIASQLRYRAASTVPRPESFHRFNRYPRNLRRIRARGDLQFGPATVKGCESANLRLLRNITETCLTGPTGYVNGLGPRGPRGTQTSFILLPLSTVGSFPPLFPSPHLGFTTA